MKVLPESKTAHSAPSHGGRHQPRPGASVDADRRHVPVKYTLPSITEISFLKSLTQVIELSPPLKPVRFCYGNSSFMARKVHPSARYICISIVFATEEARCNEQQSRPTLASPHARQTGHRPHTDLLVDIQLHPSASVDGVPAKRVGELECSEIDHK
jgi:hypothetical protein